MPTGQRAFPEPPRHETFISRDVDLFPFEFNASGTTRKWDHRKWPPTSSSRYEGFRNSFGSVPKHVMIDSILATHEEVRCGRRKLKPHGLVACGFSCQFGFRRPPGRARDLDYTFAVLHTRFRRSRSIFLHLPEDASRAWLGITVAGFPGFGHFYTSSFPMGTQRLKVF